MGVLGGDIAYPGHEAGVGPMSGNRNLLLDGYRQPVKRSHRLSCAGKILVARCGVADRFRKELCDAVCLDSQPVLEFSPP